VCKLDGGRILTLGGEYNVKGTAPKLPNVAGDIPEPMSDIARMHTVDGSKLLKPMVHRRKRFSACHMFSNDGTHLIQSHPHLPLVLVTGGESLFYDDISNELTVNSSDDAELLSLHTGDWTSVSPMLTERWGHITVALLDGRALVAGGTNDSKMDSSQADNIGLDSVEVLDTVTCLWERLPPMLERRVHAAACLTADGDVLITGGDTEIHGTRSCELFRMSTGQWERMPDMCAGRMLHGCVLVGDDIFVLHGESDDENPGVEMFDARTWSWVKVAAAAPNEIFGNYHYVEPGGCMVFTAGEIEEMSAVAARRERTADEARGA
jgi:hypothetical protein